MRPLLCLTVLSVVLTCVRGWGRILADDGLGYNSWIPARRSWGCGRDKDICYQSSQCCRGLYCATLDPNDGVAGLCQVWRPETVEACMGDEDCRPGYQCTTMGQVGSVRLAKCSKSPKTDNARVGALAMGDECMDSNDCGKGLCCQIIRAFRRGPVRMCHQVSTYSKCIKSDQTIEEN